MTFDRTTVSIYRNIWKHEKMAVSIVLCLQFPKKAKKHFFFSFQFYFKCGLSLHCLQVHILPQQMFGKSTFGLSMWLLKWFPVRFVDQFLLLMSHLMLGDTAQFGLNRPKLGPLELKNLNGKTPVLDVGTLAQIKSGKIKVRFSLHAQSNPEEFSSYSVSLS